MLMTCKGALVRASAGAPSGGRIMRTPLGMIAVVLIFTALGCTAARADSTACGSATCIYSYLDGYENVTEIEGFTIDLTTYYDVTFGTTEDTTYAGNATGADLAAGQIVYYLNAAGGVYLAGGACVVGVDGGSTDYLAVSQAIICTENIAPPSWTTGPATGFASEVSSANGNALWAEFTAVAPVVTPEPGTVTLLLTGIGMLGVMRKRIAKGLPKAT